MWEDWFSDWNWDTPSFGDYSQADYGSYFDPYMSADQYMYEPSWYDSYGDFGDYDMPTNDMTSGWYFGDGANYGNEGYAYDAYNAAGQYDPSMQIDPSAGGGFGWLGSMGGGLSSLASALGMTPGQLAGGGLGLLGGLSGSRDQTQTTQNRMDPRMEPFVYGQQGMLPAASEWFQANRGGNDMMRQGAQQQADFYSSPQYSQSYQRLHDIGMGLLGGGVAGNPFGTAQQAAAQTAFPTPQQAQQQAPQPPQPPQQPSPQPAPQPQLSGQQSPPIPQFTPQIAQPIMTQPTQGLLAGLPQSTQERVPTQRNVALRRFGLQAYM